MRALLIKLFLTVLALAFSASIAAANTGNDTSDFADAAERRALLWAPIVQSDPEIYAFYAARNFTPIWNGPTGMARRAAFVKALSAAPQYGLPAQGIPAALRMYDGQNPSHEGALSRQLVRFMQQSKYGVLHPGAVDEEIKRLPTVLTVSQALGQLLSNPTEKFFAQLNPQTDEFDRLLREKRKIERHMQSNYLPPVVPKAILRPGDVSENVRLLRAALAMNGYAVDRFSKEYDPALTALVAQIQSDHGLNPDGAYGPATAALFNRPLDEKWRAIMVALERARWNNRPQKDRYITVNLADFRMRVIKNGEIDFETRTVIGANMDDRRSPEFSDLLQYIVVNPIWNVPRQITVDEYLPILQEDPLAEPQLELFMHDGTMVPREGIDFTEYDEKSFPFLLKQLPSESNALGIVKFLFPNPYNIYMHDTPSKPLFEKDKRDFSHGCIRLQRPVEFAIYLLQDITDTPEEKFLALREKEGESYVRIEPGIDVHLNYRTAVVEPGGKVTYRNDVYGRDAKVWAALFEAGVAAHDGKTASKMRLVAQNN